MGNTDWPHGIGVEIDRPAQNGSELDWTHTDNLGSVVAITDVDGNLKEALQYDAWGSRRNTSGAPVAIGTPQVTENTDNKGYTGQENIDSLEVVHLNGRVYDPLIAKFLSADLMIDDFSNGQNYNRYSYVLNNPMNSTDPTGFEAVQIAASTTVGEVSAILDGGATSVQVGVNGQTVTLTKDASGNLMASVGAPGNSGSSPTAQTSSANGVTNNSFSNSATASQSGSGTGSATGSTPTDLSKSGHNLDGAYSTIASAPAYDGHQVIEQTGHWGADAPRQYADRNVVGRQFLMIGAMGIPFDQALMWGYRGFRTLFVTEAIAAKRGWQVGENVYNLTAKGNKPSWSTVRSRFWKNEAADPGAALKYGEENLELMVSGRAPQRYNADKGGMESMELSHEPIPARDGGTEFQPRWPQDHAAVDPFRKPGY